MNLILTIAFTSHIFKYSFSYECPANGECEIWLSIEEKLTMTWGKTRVCAKDGTLYKFDEHWSNAMTKVSNPRKHTTLFQTRDGLWRSYRCWNDVLCLLECATFLLKFVKRDDGKINHLIYFACGYKRYLPQEAATPQNTDQKSRRICTLFTQWLPKKGHTDLKNPATFAARFLKCVWPF